MELLSVKGTDCTDPFTPSNIVFSTCYTNWSIIIYQPHRFDWNKFYRVVGELAGKAFHGIAAKELGRGGEA